MYCTVLESCEKMKIQIIKLHLYHLLQFDYLVEISYLTPALHLTSLATT